MLQKIFREHLSVRMFLLIFLTLLAAGAVTFGLTAWSVPGAYTAVAWDDLQKQAAVLVRELEETPRSQSGPLIDGFIRSSRCDVFLLTAEGIPAHTGSALAGGALPEDGSITVTASEDENGICSSIGLPLSALSGPSAVTSLHSYGILAGVTFAGEDSPCILYAFPHGGGEYLALRALIRMAPSLLAVLLIFSLFCALVCSRYISRPIIRLSRIAERMAGLDFKQECQSRRRDEIGVLGRSLDQMAGRLLDALTRLENANRSLQAEVDRERALDRERTSFFSAASHELKTPVTILKGQLSGMLDGIGVYRDRDRYLLRSLQVTERMERLVREMLSISRMSAGETAVRREKFCLTELIRQLLSQDRELTALRGQTLDACLCPDIFVDGDRALISRAMENLLSNAILHSPSGAHIQVACAMDGDCPQVMVTNSGAHIADQAMPHLFEAFYRAEASRSRSTGGSGLGLYLTKMILDRHGAVCTIENTEDGVRAAVHFPPSSHLHTKHT